MVKEVGSEPYLSAVYGCTPLVRFPLASLTHGAHVRGDVIGDLGYSSSPLDMMVLTDPFDGKEHLLVTIDTRSASRIAAVDLGTAPAAPSISVRAGWAAPGACCRSGRSTSPS